MYIRKKATRKRSRKDIIINGISLIIIVFLIIVISKFITNKKEAAYIANSNFENAQINNQENAVSNNKSQKEDGKKTNEATNNTIKEKQNTAASTPTPTPNSATTPTPTPTPTPMPSQAVTEKKENESEAKKQETTSKSVGATIDIKKLNEGIKTERQGVIYLTFDDGPSAKITPQVLDILKAQNVKASFFVINYSQGNEHLLKREAEEGHTIGIHGYSHEYSKIYKSKDVFMDNIYTLQKRIKDTTGVTSTYTRFPGGSSNTVSKKYCQGIMTELTKEMINNGFKYFDWNVSSGDAGGAKTSKDVYNNVTKNLKKDRQNMVLMHDFGTNQKGVDALTDIIKFGKDNGYTFMAIDDKTPFFAQHIYN